MSTLAAEVHQAYRSAALHSPNPRPVWQRLYADTWLAWGTARGEHSDRLRALLSDLSTRRGEITPEQDAAMRKAAGL